MLQSSYCHPQPPIGVEGRLDWGSGRLDSRLHGNDKSGLWTLNFTVGGREG